MVNVQCDALSVALARLRSDPAVLTGAVQRQLTAYNDVRRQAVTAGCTVVNELPGNFKAIEVGPNAAGRAFVEQGGCTRRALPSGAVVYRLINGVTVMFSEVAQ